MAVVAIGLWAGRTRRGADDFFLGGRSMPMWAVAISVLATSQSAATFVGGPALAYRTDLTYLASNAAGLIAVLIVAWLFIPRFYARGVTSIYEMLGQVHGSFSQRMASGMFMIGRVFASGARLFIVAIPFSLIAFGDTAAESMLVSIVLIASGATLYTITGGIRAVIWTDVMQAFVYTITIIAALFVLLHKLDLPIGEIVATLRDADGGTKLRVLDTTSGIALDADQPAKTYTIWTILTGFVLFNVAAYGTDQDLAQRMLTCRNARSGAWSVILSQIIGWPIVGLFLVMGLLLFVYYQRAELLGDAAPAYTIDKPGEVFVAFILHEMPTGLRGLTMAGLFAAAMSSMDSALNAMASTTIADFIRPMRTKLTGAAPSVDVETRWSRIAVAGWAVMLASFALLCVYWHDSSGTPLVDFALNVMVFAYSGLLAVFLTTILTRRGNSDSVAAALFVGFAVVLLLQPNVRSAWMPQAWQGLSFSFGWQMVVATALAMAVCCMGRRQVVTA